jgi:hypothetical protein
MFRFVVDCIIKGRASPNLATHSAEPYTQAWREFGRYSPYSVPFELINHCETHSYPFELTATAEYLASDSTALHWYPVQWGFFSFDLDYIGLLPPEVRAILKNNTHNLRILFYYHEGDNPKRIKARLDTLCESNGLESNVYALVTGNTAADRLERGCYFNDHELLYYMRNKDIRAKTPEFLKTGVPMRQTFLLLSRSHKWWRAAVLADMQRQGLLDRAVWSYNTALDVGDRLEDCPVQLDTVDITQTALTDFLQRGPYKCDSLDAAAHNDHSLHIQQHYDRTACSIVLETLFDADGSGGAFLTEKTFKCLKHGHPFVLFAPAGSLSSLRTMGYRTFDHCIDNSYDRIADNTLRYLAAMRTVRELAQADPNTVYNSCVPDLQHNQQLFLASKRDRLNTLYERLHNGYEHWN